MAVRKIRNIILHRHSWRLLIFILSVSLLLGVYLHLILKSNINFPLLVWKTSQRLEIFWSQKIFFNLPTRPTAALASWQEKSENDGNIFTVRFPCYDISDPKWRNNKAINRHNKDQLTPRETLFWFGALWSWPCCQQDCLFILSIDFWQLSRLDLELNTWWCFIFHWRDCRLWTVSSCQTKSNEFFGLCFLS